MATLAARQLVNSTVPAFSTIRSWILRSGHAELTRPLDRTRRWFWRIDHTIQVGDQKPLAILGGSLDRVAFGQRPLDRDDPRLVALVPMTHSNGDAVEYRLEVAASRAGVPRPIALDRGGDPAKGIRDYAEWRPEVAHVADAAHVGANLLKASWESQPAWSLFLRKLQETATELRQSACAELTAPRLRPKGRFLNPEVQSRFVRMLLTRLDEPDPDPRVVEHYGWLREYRAAVTEWLAEHEWVRRTVGHLRRKVVDRWRETWLGKTIQWLRRRLLAKPTT